MKEDIMNFIEENIVAIAIIFLIMLISMYLLGNENGKNKSKEVNFTSADIECITDLQEKYGDDIIVSKNKYDDLVITFEDLR